MPNIPIPSRKKIPQRPGPGPPATSFCCSRYVLGRCRYACPDHTSLLKPARVCLSFLICSSRAVGFAHPIEHGDVSRRACWSRGLCSAQECFCATLQVTHTRTFRQIPSLAVQIPSSFNIGAQWLHPHLCQNHFHNANLVEKSSEIEDTARSTRSCGRLCNLTAWAIIPNSTQSYESRDTRERVMVCDWSLDTSLSESKISSLTRCLSRRVFQFISSRF
jgi:hypothetical protein